MSSFRQTKSAFQQQEKCFNQQISKKFEIAVSIYEKFPLCSIYRSSLPEVFCKKKVFLKISQNTQETTCVTVFFLIKLQARSATFFKKRLWQRRFPVNFAKFLRTPSFIEHLWWLLLYLRSKFQVSNITPVTTTPKIKLFLFIFLEET